MGFLTPRECRVLSLLRQGLRVRDIAARLGASPTSVSRSIGNIRGKARSIEEDLLFLHRVGYLEIRDGGLVPGTADGDPKSIARRKSS